MGKPFCSGAVQFLLVLIGSVLSGAGLTIFTILIGLCADFNHENVALIGSVDLTPLEIYILASSGIISTIAVVIAFRYPQLRSLEVANGSGAVTAVTGSCLDTLNPISDVGEGPAMEETESGSPATLHPLPNMDTHAVYGRASLFVDLLPPMLGLRAKHTHNVGDCVLLVLGAVISTWLVFTVVAGFILAFILTFHTQDLMGVSSLLLQAGLVMLLGWFYVFLPNMCLHAASVDGTSRIERVSQTTIWILLLVFIIVDFPWGRKSSLASWWWRVSDTGLGLFMIIAFLAVCLPLLKLRRHFVDYRKQHLTGPTIEDDTFSKYIDQREMLVALSNDLQYGLGPILVFGCFKVMWVIIVLLGNGGRNSSSSVALLIVFVVPLTLVFCATAAISRAVVSIKDLLESRMKLSTPQDFWKLDKGFEFATTCHVDPCVKILSIRMTFTTLGRIIFFTANLVIALAGGITTALND